MKPLILYFTANYPDKDTLTGFLAQIDEEIVKYVEIGIPTENPLYDGPTIKATHSVARGAFHMDDIRHYASILAKKGIMTFVLSYYSVIIEGGESLLEFLETSGVSGIIVPDLLTDYYEETDEAISRIEKHLRFIPFFNPATPDSVIEEISAKTSSWIYYGLQPSTGINVPYDLPEVSGRIMELVKGREINFGFGVRTVKEVQEVISSGSSGVAIGSMLVPMLKERDHTDFREFQSELKEAIRVAT